jgi:hypothetical protein
MTTQKHREALEQALNLVAGPNWGTVGYMDMQVYDDASKLEKQLRAALTEQVQPCIGKDPLCPCQDGDACHYKDAGDTKALPIKPEQVQPAQGTAGAKMPCGAVVTNVYDAYEAGKKAALLQSNAERVPLTPAQRVDIADACANLDYDDNFLCDLGKIIDLVEAAHEITKGQQ